MIVRAWRLCDDRYASTMWSGIGARVAGGRWNSPGVAVVYAAANRALAAFEQFVHLVRPRPLSGYVLASIDIDDRQVERVDSSSLSPGWDAPIAGPASQAVGDAWVAGGRSLAMAVPSIVIPGESNYLFNPAHPDFAIAVKSAPVPFTYDLRLA